MKCEFCNDDECDLFEFWCYTNAKNNPYAQGTASAGLMQLRVGCLRCIEKLKEIGMTKAST